MYTHGKLIGTEPDYTLLKTYGYMWWSNLWPYNRYKLSFKSKQCVFFGYNNFYKGYKCLDKQTRCVYISRDVIFDQFVFPFAEDSATHTISFQPNDVLLPLHLTSPNTIPSTVRDHVPDFATPLPSASVTNLVGDADAAESTSSAPELVPVPLRHGMHTRLQHDIHKPKQFHDGTVRYTTNGRHIIFSNTIVVKPV